MAGGYGRAFVPKCTDGCIFPISTTEVLIVEQQTSYIQWSMYEQNCVKLHIEEHACFDVFVIGTFNIIHSENFSFGVNFHWKNYSNCRKKPHIHNIYSQGQKF